MSSVLFYLRISHGWYKNGIVPNLALEADQYTSMIMLRYGLSWHTTVNEFRLHSRQDVDMLTLLTGLAHATDDAPLRFKVIMDYTHMAMITHMFSMEKAKLHFSTRFSSIEENVSTGKNSRKLQPQIVNVVNAVEVWLYPSDLVQAFPAFDWSIHFDAHALPWAYYIINRSQIKLEQPLIKHKNGLTLLNEKEVYLPDGSLGLRFDSGDVNLSFKEVSTEYFGLYDRINLPFSDQTTEICVMRYLPTPKLGELEWSEKKGIACQFAVTYVYV